MSDVRRKIMLNTKELAKNVLSDLMTDKPLSDILLQMMSLLLW